MKNAKPLYNDIQISIDTMILVAKLTCEQQEEMINRIVLYHKNLYQDKYFRYSRRINNVIIKFSPRNPLTNINYNTMLILQKNASKIWHGSTVRKILENPHYVGDLVQQRETTESVVSERRIKKDPSEYVIVENTHDSIISREDFNITQQLINARKRKRPYAQKHLFTNISFCACCGKSMHFKANRKGYICGTYNKHGHTQCSDHHVREADLVEAITQDIRNMFSALNSESFHDEIEKKVARIFERNQRRFQKIDDEIEQLKQDKINALREKVRKEIGNEEYQLLVEDCNNAISKLLEEKRILAESLTQQKETLNFNELLKQLQHFTQNPKLDEEILHKLIERIEIKEDGSPRIYYRFSNSYISSIFFRATHSTPHGSRG